MHSFGACRRNSGASMPQKRTWAKHLFLFFRYLAPGFQVKGFSSACRKKCEERVATRFDWANRASEAFALLICGSTKVVQLALFMWRNGTNRRDMPQPCNGCCGWAFRWVVARARSGRDAVPVAALAVLAAVLVALVALVRLPAAVNQVIAIDSRAACAFIEWGSDRKLSEVYEYQAQAALDFIAQGLKISVFPCACRFVCRRFSGHAETTRPALSWLAVARWGDRGCTGQSAR